MFMLLCCLHFGAMYIDITCYVECKLLPRKNVSCSRKVQSTQNSYSGVGHNNFLEPALLLNPHGMSRFKLVWTIVNGNNWKLMWVTFLLYATFVLEPVLMALDGSLH